MKRIIIQSVPFCYGPTSIAIALGREFKKEVACEIIALGLEPSLEQLNAEKDIFSTVVNMHAAVDMLAVLTSADLIISVCDFDFAKECKTNHKKIPLAFVDPLLWMWETLPEAIEICDLYFALEFPGVSEVIARVCNDSVMAVPQVAEFTTRRDVNQVQEGKVVVNLGGMLSPFGSNKVLAQAMCEELIHLSSQNENITIDIRTSCAMAESLRDVLPKISNVSIASRSIRAFQAEMARCEVLLTVPGMSIVYESMIAQIPTGFLLPLNYSQHLQIGRYRNIFPELSEISWNELKPFYELPHGLEESQGVNFAQKMGTDFSKNTFARAKFQRSLKTLLNNKHSIKPLRSQRVVDVSGARKIVGIIRDRKFI